MRRRTIAVGAGGVIATVIACACGGPAKEAVVLHPPVSTSASASTSTSASGNAKKPPVVPAVALGDFGEGTFGPRVVRNGAHAIVVDAPRSTTGRRWFATALGDDDKPRGDAKHELAEAPEDATTWDVRAVGEGFVLAWTRPSDAGEQLFVLPLANDGTPRDAPLAVARSGDTMVAVKIAATTNGALLTFGERIQPSGAALATGTLWGVAIDASGRVISSAPTKLADKLSAWQVAEANASNAIVAFVERDLKAALPDNPEEAPRTAKVATIAAAGKSVAMSDPLVLTKEPTALAEIDVVSTGKDTALVAWSDRREIDARIYAQALDLSGGKAKADGDAHAVVTPRGEQAITALVETTMGPALLYETYAPRPVHEPRRRFDLVRLSRAGVATATPRGVWFPYQEDEPELASIDGSEDVALLTYGLACLAEEGSSTCSGDELKPWIVRFGGATLTPSQTDLLDVGDVARGPVRHAFDLACTKARCDAIVEGPTDAAGNGTLAIAHVAARTAPLPGPRWSFTELADVGAPPRLDSATSLGRESQFSELDAATFTYKVGGDKNTPGTAHTGSIVAWVTYADDDAIEEAPSKDKKKKPKGEPKTGAKVAARIVGDDGEPLAPVTLVSERALSKGGVAVAASATEDLEKGGAVVAYVSRAEGDEEVYAARIDGKGKKGKTSRITHANGPASDVAIAALPSGGYVIGWIDGRKDAIAVYLARLDANGAKVGGEVKIGGGGEGDLSDLSLAVAGAGSSAPRIVAAWSDARDDQQTGFGDVYFAIVSAKDFKDVAVSERAILKTPKMHSHAPALATRPDGSTVITWLEDDPQASEYLDLTGKPDWGAYLARIDATGAIVQSPAQLTIDDALTKGVIGGVAVTCEKSEKKGCHIGLAWSEPEGVSLLATTLVGNGANPARSVWSYHGAPTQEVAPALVGDVGAAAFLCEDGLEKDDGRVRRLSISW